MSIGTIALISLVAGGVLAGFTYLFVTWWTKIRVPWIMLGKCTSFPEGLEIQGARYHAPAEFDGRLLCSALIKSHELLVVHTKWSVDQITRAMHGVHVFIAPGNTWVDLWGRKVAGQTNGHVVAVGRNLEALLHELAHLCEDIVESKINETHEGWIESGIRAAEAEFGFWIKQRGLP